MQITRSLLVPGEIANKNYLKLFFVFDFQFLQKRYVTQTSSLATSIRLFHT